LDEPLSALDGQLKRQISPFLRRIRDEVGIPMIYVSHALDEILYLTQRLTVLSGGAVLASGHYLDVLGAIPTSPVMPNDICNIVPVELLECHADHGFSLARIGSQTLTLPLAVDASRQKIMVGVRSSQVAIAKEAIVGTTIQNQLRGVIRRFVSRSHGILVEVELDGGEVVAEISAKSRESLGLAVGDTVFCLIKAQAFEYLDTQATG
jgi:molybdate transport system ATP-binding protein